MRKLIEARQKLAEAGTAVVFGYVRGNALDFKRIFKAWIKGKDNVYSMKKAQSGDFHVPGTTMFRLRGDESTIEGAIAEATLGGTGTFTIVKRYGYWVPGFLDDVMKE